MLCSCRVLGHPSGQQAPWSECVQLGGSALGSPLGCWRCRGSTHVSNLAAVPWAHPSGARSSEQGCRSQCPQAVGLGNSLEVQGPGQSLRTARSSEQGCKRQCPRAVGLGRRHTCWRCTVGCATPPTRASGARRVRTRAKRGSADLGARAVLLVCCTSRRSAGASR